MVKLIKYTALIIGLFFIGNNEVIAQEGEELQIVKESSLWKTLSKITYKQEYNELFGFKVDIPIFSQQIQDLEGEIVEVKGYIIPIEGYKSHKEFMFSAFPYNMCFFCGGAGPETVMEVAATEPIEYSAEQIRIKGRLVLNDDDINRMMYILEDVELIK